MLFKLFSKKTMGAVIVLSCSMTPAITAQEEPSVESLLRDATKKAQVETASIANQVKAQLAIFKTSGKGSTQEHMSARGKLASMGFGAVSPLVEAIKQTKNRKILTHIGYALVSMKEGGTATAKDIAVPIIDLVDAKSPIQSSTAIQVLGAIQYAPALDAIRIQSQREDELVQAATMVARARLNDESVFEILEEAAKATSAVMRKAAARSYGIIGRNPEDQKIMVGLVNDVDEDVALIAIKSLPRIAPNSKAMGALHDTLKHQNPQYILTALDVIEKVGKKDYSGRHLLAVVKRKELEYPVRKRAAIVLFGMDSKDGLAVLAKPKIDAAKEESRRVAPHRELAEFYVEFAAWSSAAKAYEKALKAARNGTQQNTFRLNIAQCYARGGKFKQASRWLKKTERGNNWQDLVTDPAFQEMRQHKTYGKNFL